MGDKRKMAILLSATVAFAAYTGLLYWRPPGTAPPPDTRVDAGRALWQKHDCNACHQVYGLGGYLGPDLTNVYSKGGADYIKAFLRAGTPVMPRFDLDEEQMDQLVAYLRHLDASGTADPRTFRRQADGTISK
jgi:nitric oxide reductase subunit C